MRIVTPCLGCVGMNLAHVSICLSTVRDTYYFVFFLGLLCAAIGVGYFTIDDRWKEIYSKIEIRPLILVGKFDLNMRKQRMKENEE